MENQNNKQNELRSELNKAMDAISYVTAAGIRLNEVQKQQFGNKVAGLVASMLPQDIDQILSILEQMSGAGTQIVISRATDGHACTTIRTSTETDLPTATANSDTAYKNDRKRLRVEFRDGKIIESSNCIQVWRDAVNHIGLRTLYDNCNNIEEFWIKEQGSDNTWPVISEKKRDGNFQYEQDGLYVYKNFEPGRIVKKLEAFSRRLAEHHPELTMNITLTGGKRKRSGKSGMKGHR